MIAGNWGGRIARRNMRRRSLIGRRSVFERNRDCYRLLFIYLFIYLFGCGYYCVFLFFSRLAFSKRNKVLSPSNCFILRDYGRLRYNII